MSLQPILFTLLWKIGSNIFVAMEVASTIFSYLTMWGAWCEICHMLSMVM